jgi:hypothetical protein
MNHLAIIAAGITNDSAKKGTQAFWDSALGNTLSAVLAVVGIIIVIGAVLKVIQKVSAGQTAGAVKIVLGTIVIAAILFQPQLLETLITTVGNVVASAVSSLGDVVGSSN